MCFHRTVPFKGFQASGTNFGHFLMNGSEGKRHFRLKNALLFHFIILVIHWKYFFTFITKNRLSIAQTFETKCTIYRVCYNKFMDKFEWNVPDSTRAFNSRSGSICVTHILHTVAKQSNLELKAQLQLLWGSLPLTFALPR